MKIFILEDSIVRQNWFIDNFNSHALTIIDNAIDAIKLLEMVFYDIIFLDHDLSDKHYEAVISGNNIEFDDTGYSVAKIIPNTINKNSIIIIHTHNPIGAERMKNILPMAMTRPFGTFGQKIICEVLQKKR